MTKSKGKAVAVSQAPPTSVARASMVITKHEYEHSTALQTSRKYQNVSLNRSTGRWQAWTNGMATKKDTRGPYVGQHSTEYLAARIGLSSNIEALATKLPLRLNFPESDYASDEKLRNALTNDEFIRLLKREARECYTKVERTKCMQMFLEEEQARGNLPVQQLEGKAKATSEKVTTLRDFLTETFLNRSAEGSPVAPKKLMWKLGRKQKANIADMIDDLLKDNNNSADENNDPDEVDDHQPQLPEKELDELANLFLLATVALTHPDLKPYQV